MALCLSCGEIKHGAICPCPMCNVESCGQAWLDIAFSDHHFDVETLKEFGDIIRVIQTVSDDPPTRFWAFVHYVSEHHPSILKVGLKPEMMTRVASAMCGVVLPPVTLLDSPMCRHWAVEPDDDS